MKLFIIVGPHAKIVKWRITYTTQKMKFSMKSFFSKCDQIHRKLCIWSHLLKTSLKENFICCAVVITNDLLPHHILLIYLKMDFSSVSNVLSFNIRWNSSSKLENKTLALVKIKQKHLVLICRQKMKIPWLKRVALVVNISFTWQVAWQ